MGHADGERENFVSLILLGESPLDGLEKCLVATRESRFKIYTRWDNMMRFMDEICPLDIESLMD